ncbi:MAG: UDP-N-acetylmuramate dehydrogenase [Selenomonadaceae bacterium]
MYDKHKTIDVLKSLVDEKNIMIDEPMKSHTTFRIGGPADIFVMPSSAEELSRVIASLSSLDVPVTVIGNGSNLLVGDHGVRGVVIGIGSTLSYIRQDGNTLTVGAGTILGALSKYAAEHSLTGLEFAVGIPGSVGGAAFMNAGAYDGEMKNVITGVSSIDESGKIHKYSADKIGLGYRMSIFQSNGEIITEVTVELKAGDASLIKGKMAEFTKRRTTKQPLEYPSAGSTFKRPKGYFAGTLIDETGLKGLSVGGAQVSTKHAGFIVNTGGATAADVLALIEEVKRRVMEKHGVALEPEVRIIGE